MTEATARLVLPEPWVPLDLSKAPEPPRWVVPDFLARGWVTICHGRAGAGKSMLYQTLIGAACRGQAWLGRDLSAVQRIMIVDEENPADVVIARLKAAGYVHERDHDRVLYFDQVGCRLGSPESNDKFRFIASEFRPDLVVIDSMFAATNATWANETILPLFADVFKPLVRECECALWLNHHDAKAGGELATRASGGSQWLAQVDRQIAFDKLSEAAEPKRSDDGQIRLAFPVRLTGGKSRQGRSLPEMYVSVESVADAAAPDLPTRMWLEVVDAPQATTDEGGESFRPTWYMERAMEVVHADPGLTFNGIHERVGRNRVYLRQAVDLLIAEGGVRVEPGTRNAQRHYPA